VKEGSEMMMQEEVEEEDGETLISVKGRGLVTQASGIM
jgi:hypothetical protein